MKVLITLLIVLGHLYLSTRKHWALGGIIPALVMIVSITSLFVFKIDVTFEIIKMVGMLEVILLLGWGLGRDKVKKEGKK